MTKYHVTRWDTGEITRTLDKLAIARKYARGAGHTGEDNPLLIGYPPVAYVANDAGECVYNPRFGKFISASLSGIINSRESDWF